MLLSRLAYVVNSLNPGGTEKLVVDMSQAYATEFDVAVICLGELGLWADLLREKNIPVYCLWRQPGLDMNVPARLASLFRRLRTDLIHAHQCTPWFYAALSRLLHSEPRLLFEEHGRFFPEVENKKRALVNRLVIRRLTHRFVAVSEDVKNRLVRYEGLDKDRIEVVYNGVSPGPTLSHEERTLRRAELGFGPENFVVGTVGRFDPIKNLPMLVNAIHKASKGIPSLRGLLIGSGPVYSEIAGLVETLGPSRTMTLTGHREDARDLIACMDLFVLSSFSEGTSMALLEAMAAGVPVAVTDVGGNPEIVLENETGWVVPSNQVEGLVSVFLDAFNDPAQRARFAQAGKLRYEERFRFDKMIESYRRIYREMMASGK